MNLSGSDTVTGNTRAALPSYQGQSAAIQTSTRTQGSPDHPKPKVPQGLTIRTLGLS